MREENLHSAASSGSPLSSSAAPLSACSAPHLSACEPRLKERNIVKTGEDRLGSSVLTNSSRISLVCTASPFSPGVADTVGGGGGAPVISPGQGLEV